MKKINRIVFASFFILSFIFTSCQSVFSGGTGGQVVDAESTNSPKSGIANVDVYAYTSKADRDSDAKGWKEGTLFTPKSEYYAHSVTGANGTFTISKLVWETNPFKSDFGKDADVAKIYLLFYHENYGLTKGETLIVSDSSSDTVYVELTAVRKTTVLNMNFIDVAKKEQNSDLVPDAIENIYVKVSVPQSTAENPAVKDIVYDAVISGAGQIAVSYPRWKSTADKTNGIENEPEIKIEYVQSSDEITWKACYNGDSADGDYSFLDETAFPLKRKIKNPSYNLRLYGKSTKLSVPSVSGQYKESSDEANDGVVLSMKCAGKISRDETPSFNIDCGEVTTVPQTIGTTSTQKHGTFAGLGNGYTWTDESYTGKYAETELQISVNGTPVKTLSVRSDVPSYNVNIE